jgi:hypothetical protein
MRRAVLRDGGVTGTTLLSPWPHPPGPRNLTARINSDGRLSGDAGERRDGADNRRATLRAAVGDIFKIVGRRSVSEQCGLDCRDHHSMHAKWAGTSRDAGLTCFLCHLASLRRKGRHGGRTGGDSPTANRCGFEAEHRASVMPFAASTASATYRTVTGPGAARRASRDGPVLAWNAPRRTGAGM